MNPLKVSQTQGFHRSDSSVGSPQRLQKQNTRPQVVKKAAKKPEPKREFSENVKKLIAKVRFRVKLYLAFNKARQAIDDYNDSLNPNYKYLVKVLRNPYRSNENAQRILEYIKPLPFFAKFINDLGDIGNEAVIQLCKHIRHEYIPAATCIFKEGDVSNDKFYVIIKGSISIVKKVDRNVFQAENERLQKGDKVDEPENKETAPQQSIQNVEDKVYSLEKELENLIASLGVKLKEMKEGEGFGEKALIEKSKRSTSVVTNSNCEFIVIMKNDYMNIIRKYDKRHQIKSEFMKTKIPFLNTINSPIIWEDIYYLIKDVDRPKGSILANENEKGNKIFFIVSGYCEIEKSIVVERNGTHIQYDPVKYKRAIAKFDAGNCLGEEILINKSGAYDYTIRVESTTANIYYVEKEGFLKRFPPDSIKTIIKNFLLKETVHLQKIAKLQEEAKDALYGKETGQLNLKTNQILRCLNTPSRAKVSRLIQLSQTKELESQDRVLLLPPPIEIAEDGTPPQITGENEGFYDMKNKLDSFLRNAVQAKPSTPQLPKLFSVQSPKTFKERGPKSLQSSPTSINPSKFASEKKLDKIKMGKEEIIPISSNPEQNIKLKLVYKRVETATEQVDQTPGGENNKSQPGNQKVDFNENKFDFGTKYVRRYPVDKRKISTSQQGFRPTPTEKIMWMLQRNLQNKLPEGQPEERGSEKINFHLDGGFPARRNSKVSYRKTGLSVSKRESPLLTNDNSRLDRSINNKAGEDSVLIRRLQHFQIQSSMRKKRSLGSFQKEQTSVDEILQHSKSQINFDQTPSRESNRFMVTAFTPSNKVISQERSKTAKVLEAFSP